VYRPNGLTDSPGNVAPLLVSFDGIPNGDPGSWQAEANAMRFVVVYIPNVHQPCTSGCQYATPFVAPDPTIGANDCGVSSNQRCDDAPWVKAVLNRIVCSSAPPCENIDPNKLFASGASKGGTMTTDMMCDPSTVGYFRGFAVVSIQIISPATDGSKTLPTQCRSLQTGPRGFSSIWIYGDSDRFSVTGGCENNPPPEGCLGSGFVDAKGRWNFGQFENATLLWDPVLGCSQAPSVAMFGSPSAANFRDVYAPCSSSNRALAVTRVHNGGHAQPALDDDLNGATNTNGFKTAVEAWTFLASH
jgi:poly(3-hydroxybutyrate) depolymerase